MDVISTNTISTTFSKDKMQAMVSFNCTLEQLRLDKPFFVGEVLKSLHQNKVTEGIQIDILQGDIIPQTEYIIAKGIEPTHGKDAIVQYFTPSERKPTIRKDGKADFYDMNFIDEIKKGDWLGEKKPATEGIPGKTVTGELVVPRKGKDIKLLYDRKTVAEVVEGEKKVLRALTDGVLTFKDGKFAVGDHLMINGDVGVETGNIDFDGSVTIQGIIQPGYSVKATKDISILGEMGLSGIEMVSSVYGDIFIKGGLFGQGESTVKAGKNIFIKHANDCVLVAKEDIHIGYYSIGSFLKGRNILADEKNGKIIGGKLEAKGKITAAIIGNRMERKTILIIEGFDRAFLSKQLEGKLLEYKKEVHNYETIKKQCEVFENAQLNEAEKNQYEKILVELDTKLLMITELDEKCKNIANILQVRGEGELIIKEIAYPETFLQIKNIPKKLTSSVRGSFYVRGNKLHFE